MRDALIGLASSLIIPFVILTVVSPLITHFMRTSLGFYLVYTVLLGVAIYAVANTVHVFFDPQQNHPTLKR